MGVMGSSISVQSKERTTTVWKEKKEHTNIDTNTNYF